MTQPAKDDHQAYLGDGVYATFDGWQIELKTERDGRWERIYLEPEVLGRLWGYVFKLGWKEPEP